MNFKQEEEQSYWEEYYAKHRTNETPSLFAKFVEPFIIDGTSLLELGCGNARDSIFFAKSNKVNVTALDQCQNQINFLNSLGQSNINFEFSDFTNYVSAHKKFDFVYSRFTLHSVDKQGEQRTFNNTYNNLKEGGILFIEVRSIHDELMGQGTQIGPYEYITDHYRRFININEMIDTGLKANFKLIYKLESRDLAPYGDENPPIIRLIFQKSS